MRTINRTTSFDLACQFVIYIVVSGCVCIFVSRARLLLRLAPRRSRQVSLVAELLLVDFLLVEIILVEFLRVEFLGVVV